jgi:hypothetical protein
MENVKAFGPILLALWPWLTGVALFLWWTTLIERVQERSEDDPLAAAFGCVVALSIVVTFVWAGTVGWWLA